jgi:hypothetical protein
MVGASCSAALSWDITAPAKPKELTLKGSSSIPPLTCWFVAGPWQNAVL